MRSWLDDIINARDAFEEKANERGELLDRYVKAIEKIDLWLDENGWNKDIVGLVETGKRRLPDYHAANLRIDWPEKHPLHRAEPYSLADLVYELIDLNTEIRDLY